VSSPRYTPGLFGLFSVAQSAPSVDPHWQMGVTWEPLCGSIGALANPCLSPPVSGGFTKVPTSTRSMRGALPFTVYQFIDCGVVGNYDRVEADTLELLKRYEQQMVERVFATGTANGVTGIIYPHLGATTQVVDGLEILQPAATVVTGAAFDIITSLGRLEAALGGCYDGQGVIHMTPAVAELALAYFLIERVASGPNGTPALQTRQGNWVVVGSGYPGSSPAGVTTAGTEWMYATGAVFYYRADAKATSRPSESVNRSINDMVYIAERTYVVGWDCCLYASPVNLTATIG
jgi:hypothetical protein